MVTVNEKFNDLCLKFNYFNPWIPCNEKLVPIMNVCFKELDSYNNTDNTTAQDFFNQSKAFPFTCERGSCSEECLQCYTGQLKLAFHKLIPNKIGNDFSLILRHQNLSDEPCN